MQRFLPASLALSVSLLGSPACRGPSSSARVPETLPRGTRPLPALEDAVLAWDSRAGRALELEALLDRLAEADVVFVGETHLDDTTHRVELAVLAGLIERRK